LGLFWNPFYYVFVGMIFHSLLDIGFLMYYGIVDMREFFLFNWIRKKVEGI